MTHLPPRRSKGCSVLKEEEPHPGERTPDPNVGVCAREQGLLVPHAALRRGGSQVTPGPRNSPQEPQMAGYLYQITATPTAPGPEGRQGDVCMPSKGAWGERGEMWGDHSSTIA